MTFTRVIAAAALCAATVAPLAAHHSAAMFDDGKVVEVNGTIKEMQWTNPHIWIQVIVDNNGQKTGGGPKAGAPPPLPCRGGRADDRVPGRGGVGVPPNRWRAGAGGGFSWG